MDSSHVNGTSYPGATRGFYAVAGICLLLVVAVWVVFGQTTHYGFVNYDDDIYVFKNAKIMGGFNWSNFLWFFSHYDSGFYHPLTMISLMLDYQFHGLHAGGYHLTNLVLHAANAVILFLALRDMTGALWRSAFVAAVFAVHPLRVDSVAWISERKDVLSGLFFMLTLWAYVRYVRSPRSRGCYFVMIILYALGLMSKPTAVTMPFVLLLLDYWPLNRLRFEQRKLTILKPILLEKIPLFILAAACIAGVLAEGKTIDYLNDIKAYDLSSRINNVLVSYATYIWQMIWPSKLAVFYPHPIGGIPPWKTALSAIFLAGITIACFIWRKRHRYLPVGWLWYLGMLVPMIGLVQVGTFARADHYTYLPQIGLYILLTWLAADLTISWQNRSWALSAGAAAILTALIGCARVQTTYWRDSQSLWAHTLACTTNNSVAHNNLGGVFREQGRTAEAIREFQKALTIDPRMAEAYNNLGVTLVQQGQNEKAIPLFQKALFLKPGYADADYNLGNAFFRQGNASNALFFYRKALSFKPDYMEVENNMAWTLATCPQASLRNGIEAVKLAESANQFAGGKNPAVLCTLAAAYAEEGKFSKAVKTGRHALQLAPTKSNPALVKLLQAQLKSYQADIPWHAAKQAR